MSRGCSIRSGNARRRPGSVCLTVLLAMVLLALASCSPREREDAAGEAGSAVSDRPAPNPERNAYFGELHVHTKYSFDAYIFGVRGTPDDSYRFAKGEAIDHPGGFQIQLQSGALDFQAVTDHAMYMGVMAAMDTPGDPLYEVELARELRGETGLESRQRFERAVAALLADEFGRYDTEQARLDAWNAVVEAANRHDDPGRFTAFIGYEYTASTEERGNLHRNVIFRGAQAPRLPFSSIDSRDPEDLWDWMDAQRDAGFESLAIPHNSNGSNGSMFQLAKTDGSDLDADYAAQRMRNEPLVEISQVKGTSDTHPLLSPNDEWADFEIMTLRIATTLPSQPQGSYVREALVHGIELQQEAGFNPFQFGIVAATDSHNAGGTPEEDDYHSKVGINDDTPQERGSVPLDEPGPEGNEYTTAYYDQWSAAGLAGVWAEENTRDSLYAALRRKETFGTSGPRIRVRFFAGAGISAELLEDPEMIARAYAGGVPMGGDLLAERDRPPRFLVWAMRDPDSAPLQRLQVIKGWVDGGAGREQVFDVACSDGGAPDASHRCPDNGASVDLTDCSISSGLGAAELSTVWEDPSWDPSQQALYYVRVLENPTCRWSTWDAVRAGVPPREELAATIQERAWSSPIWVTPLR